MRRAAVICARLSSAYRRRSAAAWRFRYLGGMDVQGGALSRQLCRGANWCGECGLAWWEHGDRDRGRQGMTSRPETADASVGLVSSSSLSSPATALAIPHLPYIFSLCCCLCTTCMYTNMLSMLSILLTCSRSMRCMEERCLLFPGSSILLLFAFYLSSLRGISGCSELRALCCASAGAEWRLATRGAVRGGLVWHAARDALCTISVHRFAATRRRMRAEIAAASMAL